MCVREQRVLSDHSSRHAPRDERRRIAVGRFWKRARPGDAALITRSVMATLACAVALLCNGVRAGDAWTSFRNGPQQLGIADAPLPENLELLWEYPAKDGINGTAAISSGRVFVGTVGGKLLCLDLTSGELEWEYRSLATEDPKAFLPGFQTPVTLTAELAIAGDEDGTLHAVDRETGKARWTFSTEGEVVGGATIVGERVIFGSHAQRLFCLNLADGKQVWEFDTRGPVNGSQAMSAGHTFVSGCDQPLLRVVNLEKGAEEQTIDLKGLMVATPALKDDVLYFGTSDGVVFAIDWKSNKTQWQYADDKRQFEIHSSPAVTDELVIIGSRDKRLHAIHRQTGKQAWTFTTRGGVDSSPVVAGDRVYFGSRDKTIYGLSVTGGEELWKFNAAQPVAASPAIAEGRLVIGTDAAEGRLLCFGAK